MTEEIIYKAKDGIKFKDKIECEEYEKSLEAQTTTIAQWTNSTDGKSGEWFIVFINTLGEKRVSWFSFNDGFYQNFYEGSLIEFKRWHQEQLEHWNGINKAVKKAFTFEHNSKNTTNFNEDGMEFCKGRKEITKENMEVAK